MIRLGLLIWAFLAVIITLHAEEKPKKLVPSREPELWMKKAYASVKLTDGIDQAEAKKIADAYFAAFISGCGSPFFQPTKNGDNWTCKTLVGRGAQSGPVILINQKSGRVTCANKPTVEFSKGGKIKIINNPEVKKID